MTPVRKLVVIGVTLALLVVLNAIFEHGFGDFQINPYDARIIDLIGINITLAVSLNLINGLAGQFSLGHAGFMAVGGYTAAKFTLVFEAMVPDPLKPLLFFVALVLGGLMAALAGLGVGVP